MNPQVSADWYLDETSLLEALRQVHRQQIGATPSIPGYSDIVELQRGGQGVVYSAMQRSTKRRVAIKVLLDGTFASPAARRRFEREIDLVASLRHPNIVRVYDSGITPPPDERPYLVMEFIDGMPLNEYAAQLLAQHESQSSSSRSNMRDGAVRELLGLFAMICEAVNYAHQRGVIHRDLKPSNIRIDDTGQPHILDFGLAKTTVTDSTADRIRSSISVTGQFLGSLPWASPEQVEGDPNRIDLRSDVYALGVMLYHLLTSRFPYAVDAPVREVLSNIITADPPRPNTIARHLDDEISTIALKALEKEPARRYQSAGDLARDIRRYLSGEPIEAKRDSAWYTMRKTLRRYRMTAAFTTILAIALFGGAAAVSWQAHIAREESRRAEAERQRAERRFNDVRELANTFMFDFHDAILDLAGSREAREMLVTTALEYLEKLNNEAGDDPELLAELAGAYHRVADIQGHPYLSNLGMTAGAMESYRKALSIRESLLLLQQPSDLELSRLIAKTHNQIGDIQTWSGEYDAAIASFTQAMKTLEASLAIELDHPGLRRELAASHMRLGDVLLWSSPDRSKPLESYRAALSIIDALAAADPSNVREADNLAVCHSKVGMVLAMMNQVDDALQHYYTALNLIERQALAQPESATLQRSVEIQANQIGSALLTKGDIDGAKQYFQKALTIAETLHQIDPGDPLTSSDLAYTHNKCGEARSKAGKFDQALEHFETALAIREKLAANDPDNAGFTRDRGTSLVLVGRTYAAMAADDGQRPPAQQLELWQTAREFYAKARDVMLDMRNRGILSTFDANQPELLGADVDRCDQAIARLQQDILASE